MYKDMTNEELAVLYQNAERGSFEQDEILRVLLKRMEGLFVQYANRYSNIPNTDFELRLSVLYEQFLITLREYDIQLGYKLTTACKKYFTQGLNRLYRDMTRDKRYNPNIVQTSYELMQEIKRDKEDKDSDFTQVVELTHFSRVESMDLLKRAGLNEKQLHMCVGFMDGKSASEVAEELGVTPQTISWYRKVVKEKLQAALSL